MVLLLILYLVNKWVHKGTVIRPPCSQYPITVTLFLPSANTECYQLRERW